MFSTFLKLDWKRLIIFMELCTLPVLVRVTRKTLIFIYFVVATFLVLSRVE